MEQIFLIMGGFFLGFGVSTFIYKKEIIAAFNEREEMRILLLQTAQGWRDLLDMIKEKDISMAVLRIVAQNIDEKVKKGTK